MQFAQAYIVYTCAKNEGKLGHTGLVLFSTTMNSPPLDQSASCLPYSLYHRLIDYKKFHGLIKPIATGLILGSFTST